MTSPTPLWNRIWSRWKICREPKSGINLQALTGREWLRFLAGETILSSFAGWCPSCHSLWAYAQDICGDCQAPILKFDSAFWRAVGKKIRQALRDDPTLLREVKAERENLYKQRSVPSFPEELRWLTELWHQSGAPAHRRFDQRHHYDLANALREIDDFGLSLEELMDLLSLTDIPNGPFRLREKRFGNLPGEVLRQIRDRFLHSFGASGVSREEAWRTKRWAERQQMVPRARLAGERPR